jgi:hypothetical protein
MPLTDGEAAPTAPLIHINVRAARPGSTIGHMKRSSRFLAAWLAFVAVLFSQLALASYACPFLAAPVEMTAPMPEGCDGMPLDLEQPTLCRAHGQQGDQSLDKPLVSLPQPVLLAGLDSDWGDAPAALPGIPGEQHSLLARATAPPVALRHCCLRI